MTEVTEDAGNNWIEAMAPQCSSIKRASSATLSARPMKNAKRQAVDQTTAVLQSTNDMMSAVCQRLGRPLEASNSTRLFCDMLYQQLMNLPTDQDRELIQYEIHGLLIRYKHNQSSTPATWSATPNVSQMHTTDYDFASYTQPRPLSSSCIGNTLSAAFTGLYGSDFGDPPFDPKNTSFCSL